MTLRAPALATVAVLSLCGARAVHAEPMIVRLMVPVAPSPSTVRALHRLELELNAAGFSAVRNEPRDPASSSDELGCELGPAISVVEEKPELFARLCMRDRTTGRTTVWRVGVRSHDRTDPEAALAIRAVEVLRASLVPSEERVVHSEREPIVKDAIPSGAAPASLFAGAYGQLGVGAMRGWPRLGPTISPVVRIGYGGADGWAARLTLCGLGSSAKLESAAGSAEVEHAAALVELVRALVSHRSVQPYLAVGAGVYRASVVGSAPVGFEAGSGSALAFLSEAEAGVALRFSERWALTMGFAGWITFPGVRVILGDSAVGGSGRPLVLASIGVSASYDARSP